MNVHLYIYNKIFLLIIDLPAIYGVDNLRLNAEFVEKSSHSSASLRPSQQIDHINIIQT
jgi:hypothetical protein